MLSQKSLNWSSNSLPEHLKKPSDSQISWCHSLFTKPRVFQISLKYTNAKYILKNAQPGPSQNHPKHVFLQVSLQQIVPLCSLWPWYWGIYFSLCFIVAVYWKKAVFTPFIYIYIFMDLFFIYLLLSLSVSSSFICVIISIWHIHLVPSSKMFRYSCFIFTYLSLYVFHSCSIDIDFLFVH